SKITDPDRLLPKGWQAAKDRAVTTAGDITGLHVLVADESTGYAWRTAATLADNTFDADQWIGNACVTGSGRKAVVVYAPRNCTNIPDAMARGGFVAIVDLTSGAVRKLAVRSTLAYYSPGCGTGDAVAVSSLSDKGTTALSLVDAATGAVSAL